MGACVSLGVSYLCVCECLCVFLCICKYFCVTRVFLLVRPCGSFRCCRCVGETLCDTVCVCVRVAARVSVRVLCVSVSLSVSSSGLVPCAFCTVLAAYWSLTQPTGWALVAPERLLPCLGCLPHTSYVLLGCLLSPPGCFLVPPASECLLNASASLMSASWEPPERTQFRI